MSPACFTCPHSANKQAGTAAPSLSGCYGCAGFGAEVAAVAETLVPMTLALWNKVQAKLLPTPAKFHYLFNMRELSKVHCMMGSPRVRPSRPCYLRD